MRGVRPAGVKPPNDASLRSMDSEHPCHLRYRGLPPLPERREIRRRQLLHRAPSLAGRSILHRPTHLR